LITLHLLIAKGPFGQPIHFFEKENRSICLFGIANSTAEKFTVDRAPNEDSVALELWLGACLLTSLSS